LSSSAATLAASQRQSELKWRLLPGKESGQRMFNFVTRHGKGRLVLEVACVKVALMCSVPKRLGFAADSRIFSRPEPAMERMQAATG